MDLVEISAWFHVADHLDELVAKLKARMTPCYERLPALVDKYPILLGHIQNIENNTAEMEMYSAKFRESARDPLIPFSESLDKLETELSTTLIRMQNTLEDMTVMLGSFLLQ